MSVSFLIDANLPEALARFLTAKCQPGIHVADLGFRSECDTSIWQLAADRGLTIVSKDVDFAVLARETDSGPAVIWVRSGNTRRDALLDRFEQELKELLRLLEAGERLIELV